MKFSELSKRILIHKNDGNEEFKNKSYVMAATHFTEGIKLYKQHTDMVHENKELLTEVTKIYTNRALSWHSIDNQVDAMKDAEYVIKYLDANNTKALFRRANCYKLKHQYTLAVQDLALLAKLDPKNVAVRKDLDLLRSQLNAQKTNKIQEVEVKNTTPTPEPVAKKAPEPADEDPALDTKQKKDKRVVNNTKLLDKEVIEKASAAALEEASKDALKTIPKTAAGFEKDFKQLKSNSLHIYQYLMNIPNKVIESIYKHSEVQYEIYKQALESISEHGLDDAESVKQSSEFLLAWSKSSGFDMTLMFCEDSEKNILALVGAKLTGAPERSAWDKSIYGSL